MHDSVILLNSCNMCTLSSYDIKNMICATFTTINKNNEIIFCFPFRNIKYRYKQYQCCLITDSLNNNRQYILRITITIVSLIYNICQSQPGYHDLVSSYVDGGGVCYGQSFARSCLKEPNYHIAYLSIHQQLLKYLTRYYDYATTNSDFTYTYK